MGKYKIEKKETRGIKIGGLFCSHYRLGSYLPTEGLAGVMTMVMGLT